MKKVLFIDRDGTLIKEPSNQQVDDFEKLSFLPGVFQFLGKICRELDFEIVMVTNQDGLGTTAHPEAKFWPIHKFIIKTLASEGVIFAEEHIDKTFAKDNASTRKPNTGMLTKYFSEAYNLKESFVIGDRLTDMELAKNLGCKGIFINDQSNLGIEEISVDKNILESIIGLETTQWACIYNFLKLEQRSASIYRKTNETDIKIELNLDGSGNSKINTGIGFFDHMLDQLSRHGQIDLNISVKGDLEVDEHHTIEDTALALGQVFHKALGSMIGTERYGYCLPMDDCLAQVAIDFGGRNWLEWNADFKREYIGKMPTEMFEHFFKSFTDTAKCNLNIKAEGKNEHHKIEGIFKAFAKAIKMAKKREPNNQILPSTKGLL